MSWLRCLREKLDGGADALANSKGWCRLLYAALAGMLGATAFPPFYVFPLLLGAYAVLVLLIDSAVAGPRPLRDAALTGWVFGFGHFLVGMYWVGYAFLVDAKDFAWLIPFVAVLLPGGLALFFAAACAVCARFWQPSASRVFLFAAVVGVAEYARGHILTGFPWNLPGYGWGALIDILQSSAVFGVYGLSLLTLLLGASLALLLRTHGAPRAPWVPVAMIALFTMLWVGGGLRLLLARDESVPNVRLRIVQPDTPQDQKYQERYLARNWNRLIDISRQPARIPLTHILWPEAAPPFIIDRSPEAMRDIRNLTGTNRVLLTGAVRTELGPDNRRRYYNSFLVFGSNGMLETIYDKFHLVPFGEYLPLKNLMHALGIQKLVRVSDGFSEGDGPHTIQIPNAPPASPLICYEIIFPHAVTANPRPQWLINVTDDSWFGPNAGPEQHFLIARTRAIEEGLPVARSANSGISAIIDPYGRVGARLALNVRGYIDTGLPVALPPTPYVRFGDLSGLILLLVLLAGAYYCRARSALDAAG